MEIGESRMSAQKESMIWTDFGRVMRALNKAILDGDIETQTVLIEKAKALLDQLSSYKSNDLEKNRRISMWLRTNLGTEFTIAETKSKEEEQTENKEQTPEDNRKEFAKMANDIVTEAEVKEDVRNELLELADQIAKNLGKAKQLAHSFIAIVEKYNVPNKIARQIITDALKKEQVSERTIRLILPTELKQYQSPSPTRLDTWRANREKGGKNTNFADNNRVEEKTEKEADDVRPSLTQTEKFYSQNGNLKNLVERLDRSEEIHKALIKENAELKDALATKQWQTATDIPTDENDKVRIRDLEKSADELRNQVYARDKAIEELSQKLESFQHIDMIAEPQPLEWDLSVAGTLSSIMDVYNSTKKLRLAHDGKKIVAILESAA